MSTAAPAPIGVVAHYNLLERLEAAGPGELYRARDTHAGRTVALRLLPPDYADPAGRSELVERARAVVALSHPNTTTLFDVGEHDGRVYLVFEFLKGRSLRAEMAGRQLNVRRAAEIAIQIADAVGDAHAAGFLHGGLSPESIVITEKGHAKIPALELAVREGFEVADGQLRLRDYESPEEAQGRRPDDRSDVYSVGAIMYEMLTARKPSHRGASAPGASNPHVPGELDNVVLRAVAPNPDLRSQSVAALASDLRGVLSLLDARGGAGDDEDVEHYPAASAGRALIGAGIVTAVVLGIAWWIMRS